MNQNKTFWQILKEGIAGIIPYILFIVVAFLFAKYGLSNKTVTPPPVVSGEPQVETPWVVNVVSYAEDLAKLSTASEKIDFVLKNGKPWIDYIIVTPHQQSQTLWSTRDENNAILRSYINKYRSEFQIPTDKREGYIVIVPARMIDKSRDMYLGIWGKTMGPILRTKSLVDPSEERYVFFIKWVPVAGFQYPLNLFSYADKYKKIQLGISIGEKNNSTKQLMLVFTK